MSDLYPPVGEERNVAQFKKDSNTPKAAQDGSGVSALLRASRLRIGEDLRDVARNLRIRYVYMQAIEDGAYGDLPGAAYAVGFVRAYAEYLGLDSGEVVRRFKEEYEGIENRPDLVFPVPVTERSVPGGAILFLSAIAALIGYGAWHYLASSDDVTAETVPSLPERLASLLPKNDDDKSADAAKEKVEEKAEASEPSESITEEEAAQSSSDSEQADSTSSETTVAPAEAEKTDVEKTETEQTEPVEPEAEKVEQEAAAPTEASETPKPTEPEKVVEKVVEPEKVVGKIEEAAEVKPIEPPKVVEAEKKPDEPVIKTPEVEKVEIKEPVAEKVEVKEPEVQKPVVKKPVVQAITSSDEYVPASVEEERRKARLAEEAAAAPAETPKPETVEKKEETSKSRVTVRAKAASWIQVRDDEQNKMLLTRLLRAGDTYQVPDKNGLMLLTSNAGALEILVDGKAVPSIGDVGAVRRSVSLDPAKLLDGSAVGE